MTTTHAMDLAAVPQLALAHGIVSMTREGYPQHLPISLTPSVLPKQEYLDAVALAPIFGRLVDKISRDHRFLRSALAQTVEHDDFTASLMRLLNEKYGDAPYAPANEVRLGLHRSDYMQDKYSGALLQVEINTIAASFGALSTKHAEFMSYLMDRYGSSDVNVCGDATSKKSNTQIVPSEALSSLASGIAAAVKQHPTCSHSKYVLFVVQPEERNFADHRHLELQLFHAHGLRVLRRTLAQIHVQHGKKEHATQQSSAFDLLIEDIPIPAVYYRAGYAPTDYPTDVEWQARRVLEMSSAINCPSVAYQLAGTKRVQQVFSNRAVLEQYLSAEEAALVARHVTAFYDLTEDGPDELIAQVAADPQQFVLKPQREGGGNLLFGDQMVQFMKAKRDLLGYTLMKRIHPVEMQSLFMRNTASRDVTSVSEYGFFSIFLGTATQEIVNTYGGHIVRTKAATDEDGGVAAGVAVLDTLVLNE
jgi:glutathione synthase